MKALILEQNGCLIYKDAPDPIVHDNECLIAVRNAGICNSDIHRAYNHGAYIYPLIMGHEFSGIIMQTGKNITKFHIGDRVVVFPLLPCKACKFCKNKQYAQCVNYGYYGSRQNGGFAEYISIKEWNLLKIPDDIGFEESAVTEPVAVALHGIAKANIQHHETVAILGAGFIGLVIAQALANATDKNNIFIVDRNSHKLKYASNYGVNTISTTEYPNWPELLKNAGIDVAIEACGAIDIYKHSLNIVKSHGRVIWIGNITGDITMEKALVSSILRREITIQGSWNSSFTHEKSDDWHSALRYIRLSNHVKNTITHIVDLQEGVNFLKLLESKKAHECHKGKNVCIKAVFSVKR